MKIFRPVFSFSFILSVFVFYELTSTTALGQRAIVVCHGEYEFKCRAHPYQIFEHCGDDNGVGGANPSAVGAKLCGANNYERAELSEGGSIEGNHCGYSWFTIRCKN
jgi:hypothetical protein